MTDEQLERLLDAIDHQTNLIASYLAASADKLEDVLDKLIEIKNSVEDGTGDILSNMG